MSLEKIKEIKKYVLITKVETNFLENEKVSEKINSIKQGVRQF